MAALEASVKAAKNARKRHPAAGRKRGSTARERFERHRRAPHGGEDDEVSRKPAASTAVRRVRTGAEWPHRPSKVGERELSVSNLDKVLYPDDGHDQRPRSSSTTPASRR